MFATESDTLLRATEQSDIKDNVVISFKTETVLKKLFAVNDDKSSVLDGLHTALLEQCADAVTEPLSLIFHSINIRVLGLGLVVELLCRLGLVLWLGSVFTRSELALHE